MRELESSMDLLFAHLKSITQLLQTIVCLLSSVGLVSTENTHGSASFYHSKFLLLRLLSC